MTDIPKSKLEKFGLSIRCNRKRKLSLTKAAKWTQSKFCDGICSQTSLISMEKGNAGRFADTYPKLAERLDLQVAYSEKIDKRITVYTKHIYTAIEYYDFDKMRKYFNKMYELLESVKNCLWYCDLYQGAKAVDNYYLKRKFLNLDDRNYIVDMIGEFSEYWDEMFKAIIYISAFQELDTLEYIERFEELEIEKCNSAFNKVNTLLFYYDQGRTVTLLALANEYIDEWKRDKNDLRLLDVYGIKLPFVSIHDAFEVDEASQMISEIMRTHEVSRYKKAECYYGLGTAYLNLQEYDKALEAYLVAYDYDDENNKPLFVYIAHAQRMLKQKVQIPHYSDEQITKFSLIYQKLFEYFKIVENSNESGEKYILSNIAPMVDENLDKAILNVIGEELGLVTSDSNHYKVMAKFNKKLKKTNKMVTNVLDLTKA